MSRLGLTMADLEAIKSGKTCTWKEDEHGLWYTECRQVHEFIEGGPVENFLKYCPYCGQFVGIERYKAENSPGDQREGGEGGKEQSSTRIYSRGPREPETLLEDLYDEEDNHESE